MMPNRFSQLGKDFCSQCIFRFDGCIIGINGSRTFYLYSDSKDALCLDHERSNQENAYFTHGFNKIYDEEKDASGNEEWKDWKDRDKMWNGKKWI